MQITALIQVINYLKEKSGDPLLLEGYKKLSDAVKEVTKNPDTDSTEKMMKEKESLQKYLWESDPVEWGYTAYCLFEKINTNHLFGKTAADWLEKNVRPSAKSYSSLDSDLTKKIKHIGKLSDSLGKLIQLFDQVIPAEVLLPDPDNISKPTLILHFEGALQVKDISDLERYSRLWDTILNTFADLSGEESLTLDISSFNNGNIVLGIVIHEKTLGAIMEGVSQTLASLPLLLRIRKVQNELTQLPVNEGIVDMLEDEAQYLVNQSAFTAAQKVAFKFQNEATDTEAAITSLARALKQIQSFIDKGGKIEFKPAKPTDETEALNKTLNESFGIARELENQMDMLTMARAQSEVQEVVAG